MKFTVIEKHAELPSEKLGPEDCYLLRDNWDDYHYKTSFSLFVPDKAGRLENVGLVKIAKKNQGTGFTDLPKTFSSLGDEYFSLGQSSQYYQSISKKKFASKLFKSINDLAYSEDPLERVIDEDVVQASILRNVATSTILGQFKRIIGGGQEKIPYHFIYRSPQSDFSNQFDLEFKVDPTSTPASNIHAIIGRNGVGKTYLINGMIEALLTKNMSAEEYGFFYTFKDGVSSKTPSEIWNFFAKVISVSFSVFDDFAPKSDDEKIRPMKYSYVGIKDEKGISLKSSAALSEEFSESIYQIYGSDKKHLFEKSIVFLSSDPVFKNYEILENLSEIDLEDEDLFKNESAKIFKGFSSGHSIILLATAKIIEGLQEKTVVIIDEPECHLHPPLLSAFIRALSELLQEENAVGILATHSPVVLQELPSDCVWKLERIGREINVTRPSIETFGENISVITRDVFGLEVMDSGFHALLSEWADISNDYSEIVEAFSGKLGNGAKALLRSMTRDKK